MKKSEREKNILEDLERGYNLVAEKFSNTRNFFWPDLESLTEYARKGDRILDFGCGNGRLLDLFSGKDVEYHGVDVSEKLLGMARKKYPEKKDCFQKIAVQESLPFSDGFFNVIFAISVFHHFPPERQMEAARELFRLTKTDGRVIMTVWNLKRRKFFGNIFSPTAVWKKFRSLGRFSFKEAFVPFRDQEGNVFDRYHWVFGERELAALFEKAGFEKEKCETVKKKNIVYIGRKGR